MDTVRIRQLLEKYYEGQTSFEEENLLREYFKGDVPSEFKADKEIFLSLIKEKIASNPPFNVIDMLNNLIDEQDETKKSKILKPGNFYSGWFYRVAAVIALALSVYLVNQHVISPNMAKEEQTEMQDTYENPQLAYIETKKALLYLSAQLNKGTDELKNIQKINQSIEQLTKLSEIDKAKNLIIQNEKKNKQVN